MQMGARLAGSEHSPVLSRWGNIPQGVCKGDTNPQALERGCILLAFGTRIHSPRCWEGGQLVGTLHRSHQAHRRLLQAAGCPTGKSAARTPGFTNAVLQHQAPSPCSLQLRRQFPPNITQQQHRAVCGAGDLFVGAGGLSIARFEGWIQC